MITFRVPRIWKTLISAENADFTWPVYDCSKKLCWSAAQKGSGRTDLFDPHPYCNDNRVIEGYNDSGERMATLALCSGRSNYSYHIVVYGGSCGDRVVIFESDNWEIGANISVKSIKVVWLDEPDTYEVILTRDVTESCRVKVKAASHDEAEERALAIAGRYGQCAGLWEKDEGNDHEVYMTYAGLVAQGDGSPIPTFQLGNHNSI